MCCLLQDPLPSSPPLPTKPLAILPFLNDLAQSLLWTLAHFLIGWCNSTRRQALTLKDPMRKCLLKMSNSRALTMHSKVANVYSSKFKKNRIPRKTHTASSARPSKGPEPGESEYWVLVSSLQRCLSPNLYHVPVPMLHTPTIADSKGPTWHRWIQSWEEMCSGTPLYSIFSI